MSDIFTDHELKQMNIAHNFNSSAYFFVDTFTRAELQGFYITDLTTILTVKGARINYNMFSTYLQVKDFVVLRSIVCLVASVDDILSICPPFSNLKRRRPFFTNRTYYTVTTLKLRDFTFLNNICTFDDKYF